MMKSILKYLLIFITALSSVEGKAQETVSLDLAINSALRYNHLLKIKDLQVDERKAKVAEDIIRKFPSVSINSTYQYNAEVGELVIPQGTFGSLPLSATNVILLPNDNKAFTLGKNNNFNAGITLYQPVSQQAKIKTGIEVSRTDVTIVEAEKRQAIQQIRQGVEKLYYGLLVNQKQQEEADAKLQVARIKLYDVESALKAGKTVDLNKVGLRANVADEEQNLLKLQMQREDYMDEFRQLTGLKGEPQLEPVPALSETPGLETLKGNAERNNTELRLASLTERKTELALRAAKQSYLPDLGLIAGYTYQLGNVIFPETNPFVGVNLKWNLQEVFSNQKAVKQRSLQVQQAREKAANTAEQIQNELEKRYRQLRQSETLVKVAKQAVDFRREDLKVQQDRAAAGLNSPVDVLNAKAALAKAEADLYAAQLSYRFNQSELLRVAGDN